MAINQELAKQKEKLRKLREEHKAQANKKALAPYFEDTTKLISNKIDTDVVSRLERNQEVVESIKKTQNSVDIFSLTEELLRSAQTLSDNVVSDYEQAIKAIKEVKKGNDGVTPVKGEDYFTDKEIEEFRTLASPKKDIDYFDGERGDKGEKGEKGDKGDKGDRGEDGKDGKDGSPDTPQDIVEKLSTINIPWIETSQIKGLQGTVIRLLNGIEKPKHYGGSSTSKISLLSDIKNVDVSGVADGDILVWDANNKKWVASTNNGGGGTWGQITGTLSDQTDLQDALDNLQDQIDNIDASVTLQDVYDNSADVKTITLTGTGDLNIANSTAGSLFYIDESTGNVGIGTTSPSVKLHIDGDIWANNGANKFTPEGWSRIGGNNMKIVSENGDMVFKTAPGSNNSVRIEPDGTGDVFLNSKVGINIASPDELLEIHDTVNQPIAKIVGPFNDDTKPATLSLREATSPVENGFNLQYFGNSNRFGISNQNGDELFSIGYTGNVGIGTTSPSSLLDLSLSSDQVGLALKANATQTANLTEWQDSSGVAKVKITAPSPGTGSEFQIIDPNSTGVTHRFGHTNVETPYFVISSNGSASRFFSAVNGSSASVFGFSSNQFLGFVSGSSYQSVNEGGGNYVFKASGSTRNVVLGSNNDISTPDQGVDVAILAGSASKTPFLIKAASSQTANLTEWQNSSGGVLLSVQADGDIKTDRWLADDSNTFIGVGVAGTGALNNTTGLEGKQNTFFGNLAGEDITTGQQNTGIGYRALTNITTGSQNVAIGINTLISNSTGDRNFALGSSVLGNNTTGARNIGIGVGALSSMSDGTTYDKIGIGDNALYRAGGTGAIGIGRLTGWGNTSGAQSVYIGSLAGQGTGAYSATNNTLIGYQSGFNSTTGANNNVFIGHQTGRSITTGSGNVFIGYQAAKSQETTGSNLLYIANSDTATPLIYGEFDGVGGVGVQFNSPATTAVVSIIKAATSQTANLTEWQDSSGTVLSVVDAAGNVGIGTTSPSSKLAVDGDVETLGSANGIILEAPNGTRYRVQVDNTGSLTATSI